MIIAECGTWHRGKYSRARKLVEDAARAGADAVKFQLFVPREPLFCPVYGDENRWRYWNRSMMELDAWKELRAESPVQFILSVFQPTAVEWLKEIRPDWVKVASRAALTFPYSELEGPFLISTGMCSGRDALKLSNRLKAIGRDFLFLQCVSEYPTSLGKAKWNPAYDGLSDHSGTPWPAIYALAHGCNVVEVHYSNCLDRKWPDFLVSLNPEQLRMICNARDAFAQMHSHQG